MDLDELQSMKYRDLQKVAKEKGVKANQPKAEIIKNLLEINQEGDETKDDQNSTFEIEEKKQDESSVNTTFDKEDSSVNKTFEKEDNQDEQNVTFEKEQNTDLNTTFEKDDPDKMNTTFEKEPTDVENVVESKPKPRFVEFTAEDSNKENSPKKRDSIKRKTKTPEVSKKPSVAVQARKIATPRRTKKGPVVWTPAKDYLAANPPPLSNKSASKTPKPSVLSMTYLMAVSTPKTTPTRASKTTPTRASKTTPSRPSPSEIHGKTPKTVPSKTPGKTPKTVSSKTPGKTPSKATVSTKKKTPTSGNKGGKGTQIPRFVCFARKAPNFAKLHEKQFNKMPSLVDTVEKKRKRTESVQEQIKRVKTITESHQKIVNQCKSKNTGASQHKEGPKFVPSVTSTAKMNLNFGSSQSGASTFNFTTGTSQSGTNTFNFTAQKSSGPIIKKPVNREPRKNLKTITKKSAATPKSKPNNPISKTPVIKPLVNLTNKSFSNKSLTNSPKPTFDIKASLAKPLGYKPHLGKLKPWEIKKKVVAEKNGGMTFAEVKVKQQQVIKGVRLNKRAELLMQKRNME